MDITVDPSLDFADSADFIDFIDFNNLPVFTPDLENYVAPKCNYIDVDKLYPYVSGLSLSILLLNICSLKRNFNVFLSEFYNYLNMFTFIVLTETWLTLDRDKAFNIPGFYSLNLYRRPIWGWSEVICQELF